jgi:hypothetical protein
MHLSWRPLALFVAALSLSACAIDASKVPSHDVYGRAGEPITARRASLAIVGTTRSVAYGAQAEPSGPTQLIADLRSQSAVRGIDAIVLTGGFVRRSTSDEWTRFGKRWGDLLASSRPSDNQARRPVLAMPGAGEVLGDKRLVAYGAAFPGIGQEIGHDRTASWGATDLTVGGATWRLLFLDTNQKALGSRWKEQLFWLPRAVSEGKYDRLIVFLPEPRVTLAEGATMNRNGAPGELVEIIEEYAGLNKLTAVISNGPSTNELILPSGPFGEAYVVAGNGGLSGPTLMRAGPADAAGYKDVALEPMFDLALLKEFDRQAESQGFAETLIDKAKARGSWATYTPRFDGAAFPVQGWWILDLQGEAIRLTFRMRRPDGTFFDLYGIQRGARGGWVPAPLPGG